jgi:hypothetical protein
MLHSRHQILTAVNVRQLGCLDNETVGFHLPEVSAAFRRFNVVGMERKLVLQ